MMMNTLASYVTPALAVLEGLDLRLLALCTVFAALLYGETRWAHVQTPAAVSRRSYLTNLGSFLLNDLMLSLLSIGTLLTLAERHGAWGLLHGMDDALSRGLLTFILLDLTLYLWHRASHTYAGLWRFHRVHHSDPTMNVSTALRTHFVEVLLTTLIKAIFVVLTGIDKGLLLFTETLITLATLFHHANVRFPGERLLGRFFVVPALHRVHHSVRRQEHDANYGAVLSLWDRLFGTRKELEPIRLGLTQEGERGILGLLLYGFESLDKQSAPKLAPGVCIQEMIAQAAYYRAEKRGFVPGYEFTDWLEAEKEISDRLRYVAR